MNKMKFVFFKEILIALAITLIVFLGTLADINPFRWVIKAGNTISESFGKNVERPDIPDPEKLTIEQFVNQVSNISYDDFLDVAKYHQFEVEGKNQTVQDFCLKNNIQPVKLYDKLTNKNYYLDSLD